MSRPDGGRLEVESLVPVLKGDRIDLLGAGKDGESLKWDFEGTKLVIEVPEQVVEQVPHAWAFQVSYAH